MPVNGLSVGRDYSFGCFDPMTNQLVSWGDIQSFHVRNQKHQIVSRPYNDLPKYGYIPDGHSGSFRIVRTGAVLETLQNTWANIFNSGGIVQPGFVNLVITNPDGSVSRWQYTGAVFWINTMSDGSREKTIDQDVEWAASDFQPIS